MQKNNSHLRKEQERVFKELYKKKIVQSKFSNKQVTTIKNRKGETPNQYKEQTNQHRKH